MLPIRRYGRTCSGCSNMFWVFEHGALLAAKRVAAAVRRAASPGASPLPRWALAIPPAVSPPWALSCCVEVKSSKLSCKWYEIYENMTSMRYMEYVKYMSHICNIWNIGNLWYIYIYIYIYINIYTYIEYFNVLISPLSIRRYGLTCSGCSNMFWVFEHGALLAAKRGAAAVRRAASPSASPLPRWALAIPPAVSLAIPPEVSPPWALSCCVGIKSSKVSCK